MNMTLSNDLSQVLEKVRYEMNFIDYPEDQFTVPLILTESRAQEIISDLSIRKVRFSSILNGNVALTLLHKDITFTPSH